MIPAGASGRVLQSNGKVEGQSVTRITKTEVILPRTEKNRQPPHHAVRGLLWSGLSEFYNSVACSVYSVRAKLVSLSAL